MQFLKCDLTGRAVGPEFNWQRGRGDELGHVRDKPEREESGKAMRPYVARLVVHLERGEYGFASRVIVDSVAALDVLIAHHPRLRVRLTPDVVFGPLSIWI